MQIIDSHIHFWRIGAAGHSWPDAGLPLIHRDFGPPDLLAAASGIDLQGAVLVQSQPDDRDTDWILEIARTTPLIRAVVGWVDLESPTAAARIAELAARPRLRGLRPMLQSIDDTAWILRRELDPALQSMVEHGLSFDALIQPRHLPILLEFARRWPQLPIVIDHGAKPHIARGELEPWQAQLAELGLLPNLYCKLSGLRTEQLPGAPLAELEPYIRQLVSAFPGRLMWGSDWPVLLNAHDSYSEWLTSARRFAGALLDAAQMGSLFSGAARTCYRLE
jgi:L-fuconolactonase